MARRHDLALLRRLARHRHVCEHALGRIEIPVAGLAERRPHVVVAVPAPGSDRVEVALAVREGERDDPVGRIERAHMRARHRPHVEHAHLHAGVVPVRKVPLARDKARLPRRRIGIEPLFGIVVALARQKRPDAPLSVHVELRKALARRDARMPEPVRAHAPAADAPPRAEHRLGVRGGLERDVAVLLRKRQRLVQLIRSVRKRDHRCGVSRPRHVACVRKRPDRTRGRRAGVGVASARRHVEVRPGAVELVASGQQERPGKCRAEDTRPHRRITLSPVFATVSLTSVPVNASPNENLRSTGSVHAPPPFVMLFAERIV